MYAIAGGLEAAMYTDTLQGMFIIVLSVILIPFGLAKVNTMYGGSGAIVGLGRRVVGIDDEVDVVRELWGY